MGIYRDTAYFLDALGQLSGVKKLEAQTIQRLFGHFIPALFHHFPQYTQGGERKRGKFDQNDVAITMWRAVSECGLFNPDNAVRGVGAWKDDEGRLIYHMGDRMIVNGEEQEPGRIGRRIYPAAPPIPRPADAPGDDPADDILATLSSWSWARPDVHPFIALGLIGVQMLGGALDWRPVFWLTAAAGSGKSELQKLMRYIHGDEGLVRSEDATKSGITSRLGHSSLPVALDEAEPDPDPRSTKMRDIIALARIAASGGEWSRGSSDQTGVGGKVFSAFLFSSILIPGGMSSQDVQRLIRLDLKPLPRDVAKLSLTPKTWRDRGARLKRRLIDRWPTWEARLSLWRHSLEVEGVGGRDADNWSTVLAMADMAKAEEIAPEEERLGWAKKIAFIVADNRADTTNDAEAMLAHLLTQPFDIYRSGEQFTIAQWVMAAAGLDGAPEALMGRNTPGDAVGDGPLAKSNREKIANTMLAKAGLRVEGRGKGIKGRLFIANTPTHHLKQFFKDSDWAGGAWKQSAERVPGAERSENPLTLAGLRSRGVFMPLKSIPGFASFPMDRHHADTAAPDPAEADDDTNPDNFA